jgi:hypothetical protein
MGMTNFRARLFELIADLTLVGANEVDEKLGQRTAEIQAELSKLIAASLVNASIGRQTISSLPIISIAKRVLAAAGEAGLSLDDLTMNVAAKKTDSDPAAIKRNLSVQLSRSREFVNESGKWRWIDIIGDADHEV